MVRLFLDVFYKSCTIKWRLYSFSQIFSSMAWKITKEDGWKYNKVDWPNQQKTCGSHCISAYYSKKNIKFRSFG